MKNTVSLIYQQLLKCRQDASFSHVDILEHTLNIIKARLYFESDFFIQVYRNDRTDVTNFLLMYAGRRIYARDEKWGVWHRHPPNAPDSHDFSPEGAKEVSFEEFLIEVYNILKELKLI